MYWCGVLVQQMVRNSVELLQFTMQQLLVSLVFETVERREQSGIHATAHSPQAIPCSALLSPGLVLVACTGAETDVT